MKVKALGNYPKTIDGQPIGPFTQGREYDLDDDTARKLIASAMMEEVLPIMIGLEAPADGLLSAEITGDGSGEALAPIEDAPQPRRGRARTE